jgi:hypothetical protein
MPFDACFRSELLPNKAESTHVLHPGVMHCEVKVRWVSTMYERASHRVSLTDMWLHPEIFSHGVPHAVQTSRLTLLDDRDELTRAILPALILDEILQFRRAITRMLWSTRNDLPLTFLAPLIVTTFLWTFQILFLFEYLLVEETDLGAPR